MNLPPRGQRPGGSPILRNDSGPARSRPPAPSGACPKGPIAPALAGTLEHFLAERYLLYAAHRGRLYRGQVHHTPYPLQAADVTALEESLLAAAGLPRPDVPPLAHFSQGVRVEVFPLTILP